MTQATGALARLVLGFQADKATPATDGFVMPINTSTLKSSRNQIIPGTIRGNLNPVEPSDGNTSVSGDITVPVDSIAMWYWLKAMFGSPVTTGSSSPYLHTYKAGDPSAKRPYFTIEHQYTDLDTPLYFFYTGCKVNSMSISMGEDAELAATLSVVAMQEAINTVSFDSSPTTVNMSRLKNNQLTMKEGGSTIVNATLTQNTINWNCDTDQYVIGGGGTLGAIPDGVMSVSGNLSALFEDKVLLDKAMQSTESSLEATFTGSASSILTFKFPEIKYTRNSPGIDGPKGIAISLPYAAYYNDNSDATSVKVELTNTEEHA